EVLHADIKVWASGVKGHDFLARCTGLQITPGNQIEVDETLRCIGSDRGFALGDCARFTDPATHRPLPPTAQAAHQQANLLARSLPGVLRGRSPLPFHYRYKG